MTTLVGPILQAGEWLSTLTPCHSLLKKLQIRCKIFKRPVLTPSMSPSSTQPLDINRLRALQGGRNLESVVRWTAMAPPYSQAQLLFISSPLKSQNHLLIFVLIRVISHYIAKWRKQRCGQRLSGLPANEALLFASGTIFPLHSPGLITSADMYGTKVP